MALLRGPDFIGLNDQFQHLYSGILLHVAEKDCGSLTTPLQYAVQVHE